MVGGGRIRFRIQHKKQEKDGVLNLLVIAARQCRGGKTKEKKTKAKEGSSLVTHPMEQHAPREERGRRLRREAALLAVQFNYSAS